jgi:hypothetical protein
MNVAGIDFSSHAIDVVLVDVDGRQAPRWHRYPLTGADAFDRTRSVANSMPGRSSAYWDNVLAVGIEHPAGKFGTGPLMRLQGAVLAQIPARMLVKAWPPGAWRKAVGLPGNASKDDVWDFASDKCWTSTPIPNGLRREAWPQDACDAYCIALATQHAITAQEAA